MIYDPTINDFKLISNPNGQRMIYSGLLIGLMALSGTASADQASRDSREIKQFGNINGFSDTSASAETNKAPDTNLRKTANNVEKAESPAGDGHITLPTVTVEGVSEDDLYDPTRTDHPYNRSYNVSNSSMSSKTDTPIMQTPASIQVIPKSVLHDQQAYRLQDVLKNVSGVQTYHGYGGMYEQFVLRGFLQSTLNYRNGIRVPFTKFDLANVERVEVIKGASAMLYGFGDPGGMISTVTKQPSSEPYYSIEQRFGSYDFFRTEASATGPLSKEHGLNYRVDFSYLDSGSFRQFMGNDRVFFAPTLSWQATHDTLSLIHI